MRNQSSQLLQFVLPARARSFNMASPSCTPIARGLQQFQASELIHFSKPTTPNRTMSPRLPYYLDQYFAPAASSSSPMKVEANEKVREISDLYKKIFASPRGVELDRINVGSTTTRSLHRSSSLKLDRFKIRTVRLDEIVQDTSEFNQ